MGYFVCISTTTYYFYEFLYIFLIFVWRTTLGGGKWLGGKACSPLGIHVVTCPLAHGLDAPSPATSWSPALLICTRGVFPSYICWISKLFMFYKIIIKNVNCVYLINIGVNSSWQTEFSYCFPVIQFILPCISLLTSMFLLFYFVSTHCFYLWKNSYVIINLFYPQFCLKTWLLY